MSQIVLPELQCIPAAGTQLACRIAGNGPPMLLLHGWGASSRCWAETFARFGDRYTLIAPDLPGYGQSPPIKGGGTNERLADATLAIADALGLEQFHLNGHSFCAGVAAMVAAREPERVTRLVLTCFSIWRHERERRLVSLVHHTLSLWLALRAPWQARRPAIYRALARRFFYRLPKDNTLLRQTVEDFYLMDHTAGVESARSAALPTFHNILRSIQTPTLLIGTRQDQVMPPVCTPPVADLIPNCRLIWMERCGHLPMLERPVPYHSLVSRFLDGAFDDEQCVMASYW